VSTKRAETKRAFGAKFKTVSLDKQVNWPGRSVRGEWWRKMAGRVRGYPEGAQRPWGVPFEMPSGTGKRVILVRAGEEVTIPLRGKADYVCLLHEWLRRPEDVRFDEPAEGLVVAEYELAYSDGSTHVQPVRARFEVAMAESPGPPWLAVQFQMWSAIDPANPPHDIAWGRAQPGLRNTGGAPLLYALPNPRPDAGLRSLMLRGLLDSPLAVAGLTLCRSASHPLRHLPRHTYRVATEGAPPRIESAEVDLGGVARIEKTRGPRGRKWLAGREAGLHWSSEPDAGAEDLVEAFGAEDATLSVKVAGGRRPLTFSLGGAFHSGQDACRGAELQALGRRRQWVQVQVIDASTGRPTPARIHISGSRGEYIAPYGHHAQVNANWFEDYGADVVAGGRQYAYVPGEFATELPVGDLYVEINKGFEYAPVRTKVSIRPGQKELKLRIGRTLDWRRTNWVTADTHVHFVSPHTAHLEGQAEGVNVVNLLASQWGRLFTNMGDYIGGANVVGEDTIVYVGTENRNHMLGHMSMLGTKGLPVFPMCCGGPSESFVGDPDFRTLAEWALENRRKGGVVIRPHFPYCGDTEDPVPILKGLVDALEIRGGERPGSDFPTQEWYRYLNCGYRVAIVGGTDKMGAYCPIGWMRTYALLDQDQPLTYDNWAQAVRAGRTFSTCGPLIDMQADGRRIGDTIRMSAGGGTVEVQARAESVWPLGRIEIVYNGRVVAAESAPRKGAPKLRVSARVPLGGSGWLAARCCGPDGHPAGFTGAHTSPVYVQVGETRAFNGPAARHMLALVEGGMEYLNTLATVFDESSRKRMVRLFKEAQAELKGRLVVEAGHTH
jgi:hypothetical protein